MQSENINKILNSTMENLKRIIDVDTVIGKPIDLGDEKIVPISRVTFGFVAGGSEFNESIAAKQSRPNYPHAGGGGSVVSINPVGFLLIGRDEQKIIKMNGGDDDKWVNAAKNIFNTIFKKKD